MRRCQVFLLLRDFSGAALLPLLLRHVIRRRGQGSRDYDLGFDPLFVGCSGAEYELSRYNFEPWCQFSKDDSTVAPTSAKKKHHSKRIKSNAQTTGSGNSSNPTAATTKVDVTPKSR